VAVLVVFETRRMDKNAEASDSFSAGNVFIDSELSLIVLPQTPQAETARSHREPIRIKIRFQDTLDAPMPRLLVFQHVAHEILGTLDPLLRSHGFRIRYINFGRDPMATPTIDGYNGLIVLGGPMNVDETDGHPHLETELRLITKAVESGIPVLGICLGAQLLAKALGAEVRANGEKEIGWYELEPTRDGLRDPLFSHFASSEVVFQWHGDTFDIPPGAVQLAKGRGCANQAFRFGECAYGLQFHPEVDAALIERWLEIPAHVAEIGACGGRVCSADIRFGIAKHAPRLAEISDQTFANFIALFGDLRRRNRGPHR
jgi:GMP synthase (glutamine-hydrolysing)